ncbi:MAG: hypothetical protein ACI9CV_001973 [Ilumatobacter sp.]|jgi:hypothetical protein
MRTPETNQRRAGQCCCSSPSRRLEGHPRWHWVVAAGCSTSADGVVSATVVSQLCEAFQNGVDRNADLGSSDSQGRRIRSGRLYGIIDNVVAGEAEDDPGERVNCNGETELRAAGLPTRRALQGTRQRGSRPARIHLELTGGRRTCPVSAVEPADYQTDRGLAALVNGPSARQDENLSLVEARLAEASQACHSATRNDPRPAGSRSASDSLTRLRIFIASSPGRAACSSQIRLPSSTKSSMPHSCRNCACERSASGSGN